MRRPPALRCVAAALALTVLPVVADPASAAEETARTTPFAALGVGETSVRGTEPTAGFFVPLEPGRRAEAPTVVDLEISHSPLLLPERSSVTVAVGGVPVTSVALDESNVRHGHVVATVPPSLVTGEGLFVEARFQLRRTRDDCEDRQDPALWATVHATSVVTIPAVVGGRDLVDLQRILVPRGDAGPVELVVDAPTPWTGDVLHAAGVVATQLGRWAREVDRDAVVDVRAAASGERRAVVLSTSGDLPADGRLALDQQGPVVLRVGAATDGGLRRAAEALADPARRRLLAGPAVDVVPSEQVASLPVERTPWRQGAASFAQLGFREQELTGPGTRSVELRSSRPAAWVLDQTATLALDVHVSPGLERGSTLRAQVNGIDLGTRDLTELRGDRLTFEVAGELLDRDLDAQPRRDLALQLTATLLPSTERCVPVLARPVLTILPTSAWYLPHEVVNSLDLGRFPDALTDGTPATIVVPEAADEPTTAAALQVAAAVGRWARPDVPVAAIVRSDRAPEGPGLVVVGPSSARLLQPFGPPQRPFFTDGSPITSLSLVVSEASGGRPALVLQGPAEALPAGARSLATAEGVRRLSGLRVAQVGTGPAHAAARAADAPGPPAVLTPVLRDEPSTRPRIIAGVVVLAAFVLFLLALVWFRWLQPRRRR